MVYFVDGKTDFKMKSEGRVKDFIDVDQINFLGVDFFEAGLEAVRKKEDRM